MYVGVEGRGCLRCYQRFALFDVLLFEEELTVKVREVDGIEVQERYMAETGQNYILYCVVVHVSTGDSEGIAANNEVARDAEILEHEDSKTDTDLHSSHPIPPAPTSNTFV